MIFFFIKQKTAYEMRISDLSSDVCSTDLDLTGRIAPTRTLSFDAGATFLDLKSRSLTVPQVLLPYLCIAEVPFNLVAKTTLTAGARWVLPLPRSEGRRVGTGCVSPGRFRWSPDH